MKETLLTFIFLIFLILGQAQTYIPFAEDSNSVWKGSFNDQSSYPMPTYYHAYKHYFCGDTIINSEYYRKLCSDGYYYWQGGPKTYYTNFFSGAIREDSKKVYYQINTQDTLLYDFTLNVGDTLKTYNTYNKNIFDSVFTIDSIDSVLLKDNRYHKRFHIAGWFPFTYIIEGIGSTTGLLDPLVQFECNYELGCFAEDTAVVYPDNVTICDLIIPGMDEIDTEMEQIVIYPNPVTDVSVMTINEAFKYRELIFYDNLGRKIKTIKIKDQSKIQIRSSSLDKGAYYYQLHDNNKKIITGKFLVL
ncbi:T9SS type A sorting domain-containing protein [candidate division KSB1 bacterium]